MVMNETIVRLPATASFITEAKYQMLCLFPFIGFYESNEFNSFKMIWFLLFILP